MSECRQFRVQGRVQGVCFRASTQRKAQSLALTGWVRNRQDGSVEGLVCGDTDALDTFHDWLWQGSKAARVTDVESTPVSAEPPQAFSIT